ncbi:MAG: hypothetical protein ABI747_01750 [Candidatus Moraniibacteriota bacterium]
MKTIPTTAFSILMSLALFLPSLASAEWNQGRTDAGPLPTESAEWSFPLIGSVLQTLLAFWGVIALVGLILLGSTAFIRILHGQTLGRVGDLSVYSLLVGVICLLGWLFPFLLDIFPWSFETLT